MPTDSVSPSSIPSPSQCVLREMLSVAADTHPDRDCVRFWRSETWTYRETRERVSRRAAALAAAGVAQGDHVLTFMNNGPELLVTWWAINWLGAVYVPVNTAARGRPLSHILTNADARVMVSHPGAVARLEGLDLGSLETVLVPPSFGGDAGTVPGLTVRPLVDPGGDPGEVPLARPIAPWDTQAIMYTSGTTGNAKGVLFSYVQHWTMGPEAMHDITADDVCMICGPIFHCGSTLYVNTMLARAGTMAMVPEFRTGDFWDAVRETGSTVVLLLGVMASFLLKAPATPADRDHPLKKAFIVPFGEDAPRFRDRFGVALHTVFNMTEISSPLVAGPGIETPGLAGLPRPPFELRIADANDIPLPDGTVGELLVRSHRPWALFSGYYRNPEATAAALRNGWFHTGDAFRREADGRFYFVDRLKDVIRRRGENISSFELESEILTHPDVQEAVAVAVPSEVTEDEVLAIVVAVPGASVDPAGLIAHLAERLPHHMVPRYVRVVDALPKTASGKLQKHELRSDGVTPDTFDREAAGIRIRRARL
ncbi:ATP-dependent acyl-CoA ligase [Acuticoccus sediminis]|uniref:ATP-dependent acyl-CoA ligase n=1 Tax=Acuticoccus sediminis TaxID=2184697 RepID=A0A8B2NPH9_9HYPH|nr:AMP-binding protein [Acuticoccus sediminis]RAH99887.1 ATP-dependent acyl-CoA ligase [Acuticoccus sediminis]